MKEFIKIFTLVFLMLENVLSKKVIQVPRAKDLKNHFGSEPIKNLYGPHHYLNRNSFLYDDNDFLVKFNPNNKLVVASGEIKDITKHAENIISPLLPLK